MDKKPFLVWECETSINPDGSLVRLVFKDENNSAKEVILNRYNLPALIAQLQSKTVPGCDKPIDRNDLRPGEIFSVKGFRVDKIADGGCLLIVSIHLLSPDRIVEIPLDFSPKDLEALFPMIAG
jgi:hypothetical protein